MVGRGGGVQVNDRFEFSEKMNLDKFLEKPGSSPASFTLHSILVQLGDVSGGHYVAYIRPKLDRGGWFKFDDEKCVRATPEEAIEGNFGQSENDPRRSTSSAYMLVYIRDDFIDRMMNYQKPPSIPEKLRALFEAEEQAQELKRRDEQDAQMFADIVLVGLTDLIRWDGRGLEFPPVEMQIRQENHGYAVCKVKKSLTHIELYGELIQQLYEANPNGPTKEELSEQLQLFPFEKRENSTYRPSSPLGKVAGRSDRADINTVEMLRQCMHHYKKRTFFQVNRYRKH